MRRVAEIGWSAMQVLTRHPVAGYFLLTYAFSWTLWLAFDDLYAGGQVFALPAIMLGIFGPGLVSLALSAASDHGARTRHAAQPLAFGATWLVATALITMDQVLNEGRSAVVTTVAASALAALAPAAIAGAVFSKVPAVRRHLSTLVRPRGALRYYVIAVVMFAGVWTLGAAASAALGLPVPERTYPLAAARLGLIGSVLLTFCYTSLPNALSEEVGWRGFALPRLQVHHSPIAASLILWAGWALWHAPAYFGGFATQPPADVIVEWLLMLPTTILFTWLYNRAKGSLLVTALLHPATNTATRYLPVTLGGVFLLVVVATTVVFVDRMWRRVPALAPAATGGGPAGHG